MVAIHGYPYTNFHDLNLDWILNTIKEYTDKVDSFISLESIKFANPFNWDITRQYSKNTVVMDQQTKIAYLSIQTVPQGVEITNTDYWMPIADISDIFQQLVNAITDTQYAKFGLPATENINDGQLVWVADALYICTDTIEKGQNILSDHFEYTNLNAEFQKLVSYIINMITTKQYEKFGIPATSNIQYGELVWIDNTLYKCIQTVNQGDELAETSFEKIDLNTEFQKLVSYIVNMITTEQYRKFGISATSNIQQGDLVWIDNTLYKCILNTNEGEALSEEAFEKIDLNTEFRNLVDQYADMIERTTQELNARISTIIANGQQTEGNTELIDIRTWWNGETSETAGDAVRGQIETCFLFRGDLRTLAYNDIKQCAEPGYYVVYSDYGVTVSGFPDGINSGHIFVYKNTQGGYYQMIFTTVYSYTRYVDSQGTPSEWSKPYLYNGTYSTLEYTKCSDAKVPGYYHIGIDYIDSVEDLPPNVKNACILFNMPFTGTNEYTVQMLITRDGQMYHRWLSDTSVTWVDDNGTDVARSSFMTVADFGVGKTIGEVGQPIGDNLARAISGIHSTSDFYGVQCTGEYQYRIAYYNKPEISGDNFVNMTPWTTGNSVIDKTSPYFAVLTRYSDGANLLNLVDLSKNVNLLKTGAAASKTLSGKKVAIIGDSISTSGTDGLYCNAVEITIGEEDVGKQLSAYLTYYDVQNGLTIAGHTYTDNEIGNEVSFTPTESDVGKVIGVANNYNPNTMPVWWKIAAEELGFEPIPVCWSGSSITSHEDSVSTRKTSYAWHPAQIRKAGIRVPGTMERTAPDAIIIYRGTNDFSHTPYTKLTAGYFDNPNFEYPTTDKLSDGSCGYIEGLVLTIAKLREAYPSASIYLCTLNVFKRVNYSHFPTNNGYNTLPQYNDAIRTVANYMGCGIVEFDKDGITFENCYIDGYITDSATEPTHPSEKGQRKMAEKATNDLRYAR